MAQPKYIAARDFDDFKKGDPVPASKIGDEVEVLLAAGAIIEAQGQPSGADIPGEMKFLEDQAKQDRGKFGYPLGEEVKHGQR